MRLLAIVASLCSVLEAGRAHAQAPPLEEQKLLQQVDAELARGHTERATRALQRGVQRAPSVALLERYAELALPMRAPQGPREREKLTQAGARLLRWLSAEAPQPLALSPRLTLYAAWALALRSDFAASHDLVARHGESDLELTTRCLRAVAAWALAQRALAEARDALSLARSFAPSDVGLAGELGLVLLARGEAQQALAPLAERFAAQPTQLSARRDLAYALSAAGRAGEAYALLGRAADACAQAERCLLELARAALEAGNFDAALEHAQQLLRHEPAALDALFIAAEAHTRQGDRAAARAVYQQILRAAPNNLRAQSALNALSAPAGAPR
jgi:tetratricopeptide (TPR) repeat protein